MENKTVDLQVFKVKCYMLCITDNITLYKYSVYNRDSICYIYNKYYIIIIISILYKNLMYNFCATFV